MTNNEEKTRTKVSIFGQEYIVIGEKSSNHIVKVAEEVDKLMTVIHKSNPSMPHSKIAVLAALNLADDLIKTKEDYQWLMDLIEDEKKSDR